MQSRLCQNDGVWSNVENSTCPSQGIVMLWEIVSQKNGDRLYATTCITVFNSDC